jgi:putative ABC transport system substrate-binding protein
VAWPLAASGQQPAMPVIGYVGVGPADASAGYVATFRKGLGETGYVEGQNVTVEYHWTIPIIFTTSGDPVQLGLVATLSRPGGNVTGATALDVEIAPKRLEFAREMIPADTVVAQASRDACDNRTRN